MSALIVVARLSSRKDAGFVLTVDGQNADKKEDKWLEAE